MSSEQVQFTPHCAVFATEFEINCWANTVSGNCMQQTFSMEVIFQPAQPCQACQARCNRVHGKVHRVIQLQIHTDTLVKTCKTNEEWTKHQKI